MRFLYSLGLLLAMLCSLGPAPAEAQSIPLESHVVVWTSTDITVTRGVSTHCPKPLNSPQVNEAVLAPFVGATDQVTRTMQCLDVLLVVTQFFQVTDVEIGSNYVRPSYTDVYTWFELIYPDGTTILVGEDQQNWHLAPNDGGIADHELQNNPGVVFGGTTDIVEMHDEAYKF